jgi:uncharacterized iron-regulated protein
MRLMCGGRLLSGFAAVIAASTIVAAADPIYRLSLGDPARRAKDAAVVLDGVTDTAQGDTIDPATLASRLSTARLVLVGEQHTSVESHRVELQVVRALQTAGRRVVIGLEMFPYTEQASLDAWSQGQWTESEFLEKGRWYDVWGYHWGYYRDIFLHGRDARLPFVALNAPRDVVSTVRERGVAALSREQAEHLPPSIDLDNPDHLMFFKASFDDGDPLHGGMSEQAWKGMLAAQATWDAAMAWNAVKALERQSDPRSVVVVLVGSGHVAYGLGIERQARSWSREPVASVIPIPVADEHGPVPTVRASYANFVWGVAREDSTPWPSLGLSTKAAGGGRRPVIDVEKDSPAARAAIETGDIILTIGQTAVDSREALNRVIAGCQWGDLVTIVVKRGEREMTIDVPLRRTP